MKKVFLRNHIFVHCSAAISQKSFYKFFQQIQDSHFQRDILHIKSEKLSPFGGIFHMREQFSRFVGPVIDKVLGLRCTSYGYQSARLWVLCQVSTSVAATV